MEEELISKKQLLEITGISYGALYRWKRKNLIPEEWFNRKSTFTGQETFFPKNKILSRIEKIKNMKENLSLDDLAGVFSQNPVGLFLTANQIVERNIVTQPSLEVFWDLFGKTETPAFSDILQVYLLDKALRSGEVNQEEARLILETLRDHMSEFENRNAELVLVRKMGVSLCIFAGLPNRIVFDKNVRVATRFELATVTEELKLKLA